MKLPKNGDAIDCIFQVSSQSEEQEGTASLDKGAILLQSKSAGKVFRISNLEYLFANDLFPSKAGVVEYIAVHKDNREQNIAIRSSKTSVGNRLLSGTLRLLLALLIIFVMIFIFSLTSIAGIVFALLAFLIAPVILRFRTGRVNKDSILSRMRSKASGLKTPPSALTRLVQDSRVRIENLNTIEDFEKYGIEVPWQISKGFRKKIFYAALLFVTFLGSITLMIFLAGTVDGVLNLSDEQWVRWRLPIIGGSFVLSWLILYKPLKSIAYYEIKKTTETMFRGQVYHLTAEEMNVIPLSRKAKILYFLALASIMILFTIFAPR